jgi:glutathione-regulated potassium-efflux system ancillary protein KefF
MCGPSSSGALAGSASTCHSPRRGVSRCVSPWRPGMASSVSAVEANFSGIVTTMPPPKILVIYAHPYPSRSRACKALLQGIQELPSLEVRSLYDLYPDFDIDIGAEQEALTRADLIVWLHPLYWYSVPGMMKHWFDKVLAHGWAYGTDGTALHGKHCLWVASIGGAESTYAVGHRNLLPFSAYVAPIEQTARFCGMKWEAPELVFGSFHSSHAELDARSGALRSRLIGWCEAHQGLQAPESAKGNHVD